MKKLSSVVVIAVLVAGAVAVAAWLPRSTEEQVHFNPVDPTPSPTASDGYRALVAGLSAREDGTRVSFTRYQAPNGGGIIYEIEERKTAGLANKEVNKQIMAAARVLEDLPLLARSGEVVGRRVIFERRSVARDDNPIMVVIRSYGKDIHVIESNSIEVALDFEKHVEFELDPIFDKLRPPK